MQCRVLSVQTVASLFGEWGEDADDTVVFKAGDVREVANRDEFGNVCVRVPDSDSAWWLPPDEVEILGGA